MFDPIYHRSPSYLNVLFRLLVPTVSEPRVLLQAFALAVCYESPRESFLLLYKIYNVIYLNMLRYR
jgi:hypothetical protein